MEVLYNSTVCRLCGEENENGCSLYSADENGQCLSQLINTFLPLKVSDDGQMPRTVCPGCTIQIEATVDFINLIIKGQKIVRERYAKEKEYKKTLQAAKSTVANETITENVVYEINTKDGVYSVEHPISLQVAGLERPKRKRGRPPKKPKTEEEIKREAEEQEKEAAKVAAAQQEESDPTGKRRRKAPTRFQEVVQGAELDRIFREEGVTDEESEGEEERGEEVGRREQVSEVIGTVAATGEQVTTGGGKGRGRPRGRMRSSHAQCAICGVQFTCMGRYMAHVAHHGPVSFRCTCGDLYHTKLLLDNHQGELGHQGYQIQKPSDAQSKPKDVSTPIESEPKEEPVTAKGPSSVITVDSKTQHVQISIQNTGDIVNIDTTTDFLKEMGVQDDNIKRENVEAKAKEDEDTPPQELEPEEEETEEISAQPGDKMKIKCTLCDKMFSSRQSKSMHIKAVHLGRRKYTCVECGVSFPYPRSLALHTASHRRHRHNQGYGCDLCGKVLNHPSSVVYHKEAEHAGHQYVCIKCGKHFKHKQLLQRHQLVHTQNRPFTCKICSASFKTRANLCNHQLLHTGVKKFSCDICKQKFAHKTSLTLHQRLHLGVKPFVCNVCGKSFSQKGNLSEHVRIHTGERPFQCPLCPRTFTTSSQHRLHIRRHDNSHRGLCCAPCDLRFPNSASWRAHHLHCKSKLATTATVTPITYSSGRGQNTNTPVIKVPSKQTSLLVSNNIPRPPRMVHIPSSPKVVHLPSSPNVVHLPSSPNVVHLPSSSNVVHLPSSPNVVHLPSSPNVVHIPSSPDVVHIPSSPEVVQIPSTNENQQLIYVTYDVDNTAEYHMMNQQCVTSVGGRLFGEMEAESEELEEQFEKYEITEEDEDEEIVTISQVTDEDGNPLHLTMQDGTRLAITSADGNSLQVITQDGQSIPVEINEFSESNDIETSDEAEEQIIQQFNIQKVSQEEEAPVAHYFTIV